MLKRTSDALTVDLKSYSKQTQCPQPSNQNEHN